MEFILLLLLTMQQLQLENELLVTENAILIERIAFYTDKYEIAQESYQSCMDDNRLVTLYSGIFHYDITPATGLYWHGTDYYCVWANERTLEQQEQTDRHEYCHYLIDNDYDHFCEGEK